jgi:hypothetical protein
MATFNENVPISQRDPLIQVDVTAANPLALGAHKFQLVVVDNSGNTSAPTTIDVIVKDAVAPTAVLDVTDANGKRLDPTVPFGSPFFLSGARSSDAGGGKVAEYRFTLIST